MKKNYPVTQEEYLLAEDAVVISTTDLKGITMSANEDFCRYSRFGSEELIGKSHNIVRHPDMPPAAFADLWNTLKQGDPWLGVVKNRCKNGDFYWVNAFVAPLYQQGQIVAYQSVRTKPRREWVERAEVLYKAINEQRRIPFNSAISLNSWIFAGFAILLMAMLSAFWAIGELSLYAVIGGLLPGVGICWGLSRLLTRSLRKIAALECGELERDKLRLWIYTGRCDELGQLQLAKLVRDAKAVTIKARVVQYSQQLTSATLSAESVAEQTEQLAYQQQADTGQLATAMEQMVVAVNEVADNAVATSETIEHAGQNALNGKSMVTATMSAFQGLVTEVDHSSDAINKLASESEQINVLLDVIRKISDQTNLLALNAAIEAARAGEHGRGFAVVADEVRNLAASTQKSAEEICQMIDCLQQGTQNAVAAMERARSNVHTGVEQARETESALESIADAISEVSEMASRIADSSEHQRTTAEEIYTRIHTIRKHSEKTAQDSKQSAQVTTQLTGLSEELKDLVVHV